MFETMRKWKAVSATMKKQKKLCNGMLRPMRKQVNDSFRMHAASTWATFFKDHKDLLDASILASKEEGKAKNLYIQARRRLVSKYTPLIDR